jgi:hypothetical protein
MVEVLQNFDLFEDKFLQSFAFELIQGDDFDGYCLIYVDRGVLVLVLIPR